MGNSLRELLERVRQASGRLMRVEREPLPGAAGAHASTRLRLLFDVGGIEVRAGPGAGGLEAVAVFDPARAPSLVPADEEDPWWAILGNPLTRLREDPDGSLLLQFRGDEESPKRLVLSAQGRAVAVRKLV